MNHQLRQTVIENKIKKIHVFIWMWYGSVVISFLASTWFLALSVNIAHCFLQGTNNPILLNHMHHGVTMAKYHAYGCHWRKDQKYCYSAALSQGFPKFRPSKALGTSQLVLVRSPGTGCCQSNQCPSAVDKNTMCIIKWVYQEVLGLQFVVVCQFLGRGASKLSLILFNL